MMSYRSRKNGTTERLHKRLFEQLHKYFTEYLPEYRSDSEHTLRFRSYRTSVDMYLEFLKQKHEVSLFDISFSI